jgi:hypothetical protein
MTGLLAGGVLAAGSALGPAAAADPTDDDPMPPEYPSVQKPTDKETGTPDPAPPDWPLVAKSEIDAVGDPVSPSWPAPAKP